MSVIVGIENIQASDMYDIPGIGLTLEVSQRYDVTYPADLGPVTINAEQLQADSDASKIRLYTEGDVTIDDLQAFLDQLAQSDFPDLWLSTESHLFFLRYDELALLIRNPAFPH